MSDWIRTKDRLPKDRQKVLVFDIALGGIDVAECRLDGGNYFWDCDTYGMSKDEVSDWMPLPERPEK